MGSAALALALGWMGHGWSQTSCPRGGLPAIRQQRLEVAFLAFTPSLLDPSLACAARPAGRGLRPGGRAQRVPVRPPPEAGGALALCGQHPADAAPRAVPSPGGGQGGGWPGAQRAARRAAHAAVGQVRCVQAVAGGRLLCIAPCYWCRFICNCSSSVTLSGTSNLYTQFNFIWPVAPPCFETNVMQAFVFECTP